MLASPAAAVRIPDRIAARSEIWRAEIGRRMKTVLKRLDAQRKQMFNDLAELVAVPTA